MVFGIEIKQTYKGTLLIIECKTNITAILQSSHSIQYGYNTHLYKLRLNFSMKVFQYCYELFNGNYFST